MISLPEVGRIDNPRAIGANEAVASKEASDVNKAHCMAYNIVSIIGLFYLVVFGRTLFQ